MASRFEFRLLGSFEVRRSGALVRIASNKAAVLLATLLLAEGRPVPIDTLIERLWGMDPPGSAHATLQVHVMRLRRALGVEQLIRTTPGGYAIDRDDVADVDVLQFRALLARASMSNTAGDTAEEFAALTEALALWRGPALLGVQSESLHHTVVPHLTDERLSSAERRAELAIAAGAHDELVGELAPLVGQYPLRERLGVQFIEALRRCGRRVEALDAYRRMQGELRAKLGIDPGKAAQQLYLDILAEDGIPESPQVRPEPTVVAAPRQLPPPPRGFIGRIAAQKQVVELLRRSAPLVVVSGPPGVGKSAFVAHVAHLVRNDFPDGQLYVDLHGHSPEEPLRPAMVLETFLRALGCPAGAVPGDLQEQVSLYRTLLAERRVLVVLDDAATSDQVRSLLPVAPGSATLVTSRQDLRGLAVSDGHRRVTLEPMSEREALDVLADMVSPDRIAAETSGASAVVLACGRLPLALRIAGANLQAHPYLPLAQFAEDLHSRGRMNGLRLPGDEGPGVAAAFDLSLARLGAEPAQLFRLLGIAPCRDITPAAATALLGTDASPGLDLLVAANLAVPSAAGRYQMHDLLRDYATSLADDDPDATSAALFRLFDHYLHTARAATRALCPEGTRLSLPPPVPGAHSVSPPTAQAALAWLDTELPNLVAMALRASDYRAPLYARQLAETLREYLQTQRRGAAGLAICGAARDAARRVGDRLGEAIASDLSGLIHYVLADYATAIDRHQRALETLDPASEPRLVLGCLHNLARAHSQVGQHDIAARHHEQALAIAEALDDKPAQAVNLNHLGFISIVAGQPAKAAAWHARAVEISHELNDVPTLARAYNGIGIAGWATGDLRDSIAAHELACKLAEQMGDEHLRGFSSVWLAGSRCAAAEYDQAIADAETGIQLGHAVGEQRIVIMGAMVATDARRRTGHSDGAVAAFRTALARADEIDFRYGQMPLLLHIAELLRIGGDPTGAMSHAHQALEVARGIGMQMWESIALTEIAHCQVELGVPGEAEHPAAAGLALAERGGYRRAVADALQVLGHVAMAKGDREAGASAWRRAHEILADTGARGAAELQLLITATAPTRGTGRMWTTS
jgi:DNA-binding SARP family transcriptional activator/tetratricopeptide (TPR) repeat protein